MYPEEPKYRAASIVIPTQRVQYTLVGRMMNGKEEVFFFQSFGTPESVLNYVSNMSKGTNKVHAIYEMDIDGLTEEMTIGFNDGRLGLIRKPELTGMEKMQG